jgi:hypothetical protein
MEHPVETDSVSMIYISASIQFRHANDNGGIYKHTDSMVIFNVALVAGHFETMFYELATLNYCYAIGLILNGVVSLCIYVRVKLWRTAFRVYCRVLTYK